MAVKALVAERDALRLEVDKMPAMLLRISELEEIASTTEEISKELRKSYVEQRSLREEIVHLKDRMETNVKVIKEMKASLEKVKTELLFKKNANERLHNEKKFAELALNGMQDKKRKLMDQVEVAKKEAELQVKLREEIEGELKHESSELVNARQFHLMDMVTHNKELKKEIEKRKMYEQLPSKVEELQLEKKKLENLTEILEKNINFERSLFEVHEDNLKRYDVEMVKMEIKCRDVAKQLADSMKEAQEWRDKSIQLQQVVNNLNAQLDSKNHSSNQNRLSSPPSTSSSTSIHKYRPLTVQGIHEIGDNLKVYLSLQEDVKWLEKTSSKPHIEYPTYTSQQRLIGIPPKGRLDTVLKDISTGIKLVESHEKEIKDKNKHAHKFKEEIKYAENELNETIQTEENFNKAYEDAKKEFNQTIGYARKLRDNFALLSKIVTKWKNDCIPPYDPYRIPLRITPGWKPPEPNKAATQIQKIWRSILLRRKRHGEFKKEDSRLSTEIKRIEAIIKKNDIERQKTAFLVRAAEVKVIGCEDKYYRELQLIRDLEVAIIAIKSRLVGLEEDKYLLEEQIYRVSLDDQIRNIGYRSFDVTERAATAVKEAKRERKWWPVGGGPQRSLTRPSTIPLSWPALNCEKIYEDPILIQSGLIGVCSIPSKEQQNNNDVNNNNNNNGDGSELSKIPVVVSDWSRKIYTASDDNNNDGNNNSSTFRRSNTGVKKKVLVSPTNQREITNGSKFCGSGLGLSKNDSMAKHKGRTGSAKVILAAILAEKNIV